MTLQELQDYIVYLKDVKRSVRQKLEVRREQQAKGSVKMRKEH